MAYYTDPLSRVRIAAPCRADWERMRGNERVRFCGECSMNVYNLSDMTRKDAEALVSTAEGRLCVRYYHRPDGTILTANCPVGVQKLKRRVQGISRAVVSSILSFIAGMFVFAGLERAQSSLVGTLEPALDLIAPVPLEDATAPPPSENYAPVKGMLAFESNEGREAGRMTYREAGLRSVSVKD